MSKKGAPRKMSDDPWNMPSSSRSDPYALRQESQQSDRCNNSIVRVFNSSSEEMENSNRSSSGSSRNGHDAQQNNCVRRIFNSSEEEERMAILEQKYTLLFQEFEKFNLKYQRLKEKYIFVKQDNDKLQAELNKNRKMNKLRDQIVIESSSSEEEEEDNQEELAIEEQKVETKEIQRKTSIASSRKRRAHFRVEYLDSSSQKRVRVVTEMTEEEQTNSSTSQLHTEGQMTGMMVMKALRYAMKSKNQDSEDEDSE